MTSENKTKNSEQTTLKYLLKTIKQLKLENEKLRMELLKFRKVPSGKISLLLLGIGALSLAESIIVESPVLAFIGLSLTFWGILFLFIKPVRFVRSTLLDSMALTPYSTVDRIISDLNYKGKAFYIPPYPKEVYLPDHLKGLKDMVAFISAQGSKKMPPIEDLAKRRFLLQHPRGICVTPPGLGLLTLFEEEIGKDFSEIDTDELPTTLSELVIANFHLARDIKLEMSPKKAKLTVEKPLYGNLYGNQELKSLRMLGGPLISAIACALAKSSGKIVMIERQEIIENGERIDIIFRFIED